VKFAPFALLPLLAGCVHTPTLDELQEQCMKRGGMLMIVYTQEITLSGGPGEQIPSAGRCVMPESFDKPSGKPLQPPPPEQPPPQQRIEP
jgi:hypothetical protein